MSRSRSRRLRRPSAQDPRRRPQRDPRGHRARSGLDRARHRAGGRSRGLDHPDRGRDLHLLQAWAAPPARRSPRREAEANGDAPSVDTSALAAVPTASRPRWPQTRTSPTATSECEPFSVKKASPTIGTRSTPQTTTRDRRRHRAQPGLGRARHRAGGRGGGFDSPDRGRDLHLLPGRGLPHRLARSPRPDRSTARGPGIGSTPRRLPRVPTASRPPWPQTRTSRATSDCEPFSVKKASPTIGTRSTPQPHA